MARPGENRTRPRLGLGIFDDTMRRFGRREQQAGAELPEQGSGWGKAAIGLVVIAAVIGVAVFAWNVHPVLGIAVLLLAFVAR